MGLNKEAIDNSIVLLRDYDDIIVNKRFIREFLSIIGDSREETIGYHFINSKSNPASLDSKDMCIYIDPVYMPYSVESNIRLFQAERAMKVTDAILLGSFWVSKVWARKWLTAYYSFLWVSIMLSQLMYI